MTEVLTILVRYPLESGRLVLRSDADWERDVEPLRASDDHTRFEFELPARGRYTYYKPVLRNGDTVRWSQGDNYLVVSEDGGRHEIHPHFFRDDSCSTCTPFEIASKTSGRVHRVRVFYPPGYSENVLESYPVLYMHDGQNLFFPDEAFNGQDWMIDETLRILDSMNLVRRMIVVGVYAGDRMSDYTKPGYEDYGRYLVEDVKPWIDAHYRTLSGPTNTAVMGSSLGGVCSLHLAWRWPEVFGHAVCLSSTFGWQDDLFERVATDTRRPIRIYLDSGWPGDNYEVTRRMRSVLARRGYGQRGDLLYLAFPGDRHDEQAWSLRAHIPVQFCFGAEGA